LLSGSAIWIQSNADQKYILVASVLPGEMEHAFNLINWWSETELRI
jgi:hypothetical protein